MDHKPIPKRVRAFLLCFTLLVGLLPTAALAAEGEYPTPEFKQTITAGEGNAVTVTLSCTNVAAFDDNRLTAGGIYSKYWLVHNELPVEDSYWEESSLEETVAWTFDDPNQNGTYQIWVALRTELNSPSPFFEDAVCEPFTINIQTPQEAVPYLVYTWDENNNLKGEEKSLETYTEISTASMPTEWGEAEQDTWYVATGTTTIPQRVTVTGTVNLILTDGCTLTVTGGIQVAEGSTLNIYGQSGNTGQLIAAAAAAIGSSAGMDLTSEIKIFGPATVNAKADGGGAAIGSGAGADLTSEIKIFGPATVNATADGGGAAIDSGKDGDMDRSEQAAGSIYIRNSEDGNDENAAENDALSPVITARVSGGAAAVIGCGQNGGIGVAPSIWIGGTAQLTLYENNPTIAGYEPAPAIGAGGYPVEEESTKVAGTIKIQNDKLRGGLWHNQPTLTLYGTGEIGPESAFESGGTLNISETVPITINCMVTVKAGAGGAVSGGGEFEKGSTVTVTATPNSGYCFVRWAENGAEVSTDAAYTFTVAGNRNLTAEFAQLPAPSSGTLTITGIAQYGQTLTASYTPVDDEEITYQWKRNGETISGATSASYTLTAEDVGQSITVTATATDGNHTGSVTSDPVTVGKASQTAPAAPTAARTTTSSITLNTIPDNSNGGAAEYGISKDGGKTWTWQSGPEFTGLSSSTTYQFAARYAETDNYAASDSSSVVSIATDRRSSGGNSSGGDSTPTYRPDVEEPKNGAVSVSPRNPERGDDVTITPEPDEGYEVGEVTVIDRSGEAVEVTDNGDGTYTFEQPRGRVTISVTFQEIPPEPLPFTDVPEGHWAYDAIRYVYGEGLMAGAGGSAFHPDGVTTRGQIVTILWRLAGSPQVNYRMDFDDVDPAAWYAEAVRWASALRIAGGYGDGRFGPDDPITREQLAVMLYQYAWNMGYDLTAGGMALREYDDYDRISGWALEALDWAVSQGIIGGASPTALAPGGQATRAQAAVMLERFCESDK